MALTANRNTPEREGKKRSLPVKGATKIFAGALVAMDANGFVVPGAAAAGLIALGRAECAVDNSGGADGALTVEISRGIFPAKSGAGADLIARDDIGKTAYFIDDETVGLVATSRSAAGKIYDVDTAGVWVEFI